MRFIVSGFPRSRTSALMAALHRGGMRCIYDADFLPIAEEFNPQGFFEKRGPIELTEEEYENSVVKMKYSELKKIPMRLECKIAFLIRDSEEIKKSQQRALGQSQAEVKHPLIYTLSVGKVLAGLETKSNCEVTIVDSSELIDCPLGVLADLVIAGWPIPNPNEGALAISI